MAPERTRGLHLNHGDLDWPQLRSVGAAAFVALDPAHLPPGPRFREDGRGRWVWRPWVGGRVVRDYAPARFVATVTDMHEAAGRPRVPEMIFLNEPNLEKESGYPTGSREAAEATVAWGTETLGLLRGAFPGTLFHSPPLSPRANDMEFYGWMRPLVDACDVLDVHCYGDADTGMMGEGAFRWRSYVDMFKRQVFISECGYEGRGTAAYGRDLVRYWRALDGERDVEAACAFVWNQPGNEWDGWVLQNTEAARELIKSAREGKTMYATHHDPRFWQQNPLWEGFKLPGGGSVRAYGCTLCALTRAHHLAGVRTRKPFLWSPPRLAKMLQARGGFNGNFMAWDSGAIDELGWLRFKERWDYGGPLPRDEIERLARLVEDPEKIVLFQLDSWPWDIPYDLDEHWVLAERTAWDDALPFGVGVVGYDPWTGGEADVGAVYAPYPDGQGRYGDLDYAVWGVCELDVVD